MKSLVTSIVFLTICFGSIDKLRAQERCQFEHLSLEEGISHNLAYCILQDSRGLLWFGTMYGLVKYDGYSFTTYRHEPLDQFSLSNDDIVSLCEDRHGNIWIGTYEGGLNKFDRANGKFIRFIHDPAKPEGVTEGTVWAIAEDHEGKVWFGTNGGGLDMYDPDIKIFKHFKNDPKNAVGLSDNFIFSIVVDDSDKIFIGTRNHGVDCIEKNRTTFTRMIYDSLSTNGLRNNTVRSLFIDHDRNLWIGSLGGGVSCYIPTTRKYTTLVHKNNGINSLSMNYVSCIEQDNSGFLWFGTPEGLERYDAKSRKFDHYTHHDSDPNSLSSNEIVALLYDKSGVLWIGSYRGGIDKYAGTNRRFTQYRHLEEDTTSLSDNNVQALFEDHLGVLWIGTNNGLNNLDDKTGMFRHFIWPIRSQAYPGRYFISSIAEDYSGNLWIGSRNGVKVLDAERKHFVEYHHDPKSPGSLCSGDVTAIYVRPPSSSGSDPEIWIGTSFGLDRFDPKTRSFTHFLHNESDTFSLSHNYVISISSDKEGNLWIGTFGGINVLRPNKQGFTHYKTKLDIPSTLSNNYCLSLLEDSQGSIWIGTGGGLNKYSGEGEKFIHYFRHDGLPNDVICGIAEEQPGILWFSTNNGLSRFDTRANSFMNYTIADGLQSNMFLSGSFCRRKNGDIVFGGINGFNIVRTDQLQPSLYIPPVVITSLNLLATNDTNFVSDITLGESVRFSYKENNFTITFAALDYIRPEKNQYRYMLEGMDNGWINNGNKHSVRYMNLDPGEYRFLVKGSNHDGIWNEKPTAIQFIITPPFWKTSWFYSISGLAFCLIVFGVHSYRVREKVRRLTELEQVRSSENKIVRKRAADDFHDEFGHKLTRIYLLSQVVKGALIKYSPELAENLDKISQTSNDLSMGMRDFLWTLNPDRDTAYDVVFRLKDFGDELFNFSGCAFRVNGITKDLEQIQLAVDWRRHLLLIFKEAMTNVLKHSGCQNVTLDVVQIEGNLDIRLSDDGKGFHPNHKIQGQGLASMQNRSDKLKGSLTIDSILEKGTVVRFVGKPPVYSFTGNGKNRYD